MMIMMIVMHRILTSMISELTTHRHKLNIVLDYCQYWYTGAQFAPMFRTRNTISNTRYGTVTILKYALAASRVAVDVECCLDVFAS